MSPRTIARRGSLLLAGAAMALVVTHASPPASQIPPGAGALQAWEDGSWRLEGCRPGFACELPLTQVPNRLED